jgi:uncharacterized repeat protein (TIGR03803 family)
MTMSGGSGTYSGTAGVIGGAGVLFRINTDGTGYTNLHNFGSDNVDGSCPEDSLVLVGTTLYGMTYQGGYGVGGVIFKIDLDGSGYALLRHFDQYGGGMYPIGSLTLSGSTLYGMTSAGGGNFDNGVVFRINTDGTEYNAIHAFTGGAGGSSPHGSLTLSGSTLYGMTHAGGSDPINVGGLGVVFQINTDGTGYNVIHTFTDDGGSWGSLTLSDSTLYGLTGYGGSGGFGTVFSLTLGE